MYRILIIDDEEVIRFAFKTHLLKEGYEVLTAENYPAAIEIISGTDLDLIIVDIILGSYTGIDILKEVKRLELGCPVIMITGEPNINTSAEAVRLGAFDYLPKPVHRETLLNTTRLGLKHKSVVDEKEKYRRNLEAIFSSMNDAVVSVDKEMRVLEANEATKRIFGFSTQEMIGKTLKEIPIPCQRQCLQLLEQTLKTLTPVKEYYVEPQADEPQRRTLVLNTSLLTHGGGRHSGAILVARDITRITLLENELNERHRFHNIIGKSREMQDVYKLIQDLSETETTVLITGESGTGKELVANALHYNGLQSDKPLIVANCSVFAESLLESELFGHVRGAFTGAVKDKIGRFQLADGGTLFLDEVGDISPLIQLKLLRVLQERKIEKVGSAETLSVNVRVLAATNRNLKQMVDKGEFRKDFYYRLKVVEIHLPPLRKRKEDIPLLVDHLGYKLSQKMNKPFSGNSQISKSVMDAFMQYSWPGNIRELENAMEHAFVLSRGNTISIEHLPIEICKKTGHHVSGLTEGTPMNEKDHILHILNTTGWNKAKAARALGVSRRTLYRKIDLFKFIEPVE